MPDSPEFSLVQGGLLYRLFLRCGLLRPPFDLQLRGILGLILVTWLPLLVLSAVEGQAVVGSRLPFLQDLATQARFLLALPLLIVAEAVAHSWLAPALRRFVAEAIVRREQRSRFDEIVASTMRLRDSLSIELFLIALVATGGHYLWAERFAIRMDTWYTKPAEEGLRLSMAGNCYAWLSLPIFQFILIRWYYRLLLWCRFLWRVSRLDLELRPSHPDRAGGLGFLGNTAFAFAPLLVGQSVLVSAMIADRIHHQGAQLPAFKLELAGVLLFALLQVLGPVIVFVPSLAAAKRRGLLEYGVLADRYVRQFDQKWLKGVAPDEPLLGHPDIQSLADLSNSFAVVREMRAVPFGKEVVIRVVAVTALPLLPLALTMFPLEELVRRLLGALL